MKAETKRMAPQGAEVLMLAREIVRQLAEVGWFEEDRPPAGCRSRDLAAVPGRRRAGSGATPARPRAGTESFRYLPVELNGIEPSAS